MSRTKRVLLTNLELEVMHVVWGAPDGALAVRDAVDRLNDGRTKPLAYNTVQTMLTILKDKGVVGSSLGAGRAHRFFAKAAAENGFDLPEIRQYGVAMGFLPRETRQRRVCERAFERARETIGYRLLQWLALAWKTVGHAALHAPMVQSGPSWTLQ